MTNKKVKYDLHFERQSTADKILDIEVQVDYHSQRVTINLHKLHDNYYHYTQLFH